MKPYKIEEESTALTANEPDSTIEYTYADYLTFEFEEMVELIKGRIYKMSPAPKTLHQKIVSNMHGEMYIHFKNHNCNIFVAPTDVVLPIKDKKRDKATTVVQPDIFVVCNENLIEEGAVFGVPNLVIEVLSNKRDLTIKHKVYEEAGVPEYWVVFPHDKLIQVFVLDNGSYNTNVEMYEVGEFLTSPTMPDLSMELSKVFV